MTRVLVLVAMALFVAYLLAEGLGRLRGRLGELLSAMPANGGATGGGAEGERSAGELVACAACGIHVLRSRALAAAERRHGAALAGAGESRYYCSEVCRSRAASGSASGSAA